MVTKKKKAKGYGKGSPQKSLRFTQTQHDLVADLMTSHPAQLHTFVDALRAVVTRAKYIPKAKMAKIVAAFENGS